MKKKLSNIFLSQMAEILVYGPMDWFSATEWVRQMDEAKNEDLTARINSNGGGPEDGFATITKFKEHPGKKIVKIDGKAFSMAAFLPLYADFVESNDVAEFLFHRAAFPSFVENSDLMTEAMAQSRDRVNKNLRKAMEAKLDIPKFEKITGVTLDELFSNDDRIEVSLSAQQAKQIKLVNKIVKITPQIAAQINTSIENDAIKLAAKFIDEPEENQDPVNPPKPNNNIPTSNFTTMSIEKLKAENPGLYAEIIEEGKKLGASTEKDRIGSLLAFIDVDKDRILKAIKEDQVLTQTEQSELVLKANSPEYLKKLKAQTKDVSTDPPDESTKDGEEKDLEASKELVKGHLNVTLS